MKKLIYLEDAIDAICKKCKADYPDTTACDICDDISILKSLPSIEPEIITCKECKWWDNRVFRIHNRCSIFDRDTEMTFYCKHGRREFT